MLNFLASSFATFSKASFIISEAHSETYTSFLKVFMYSSHSPLLTRRESHASSFCACNQCHCSILLAPNTLWLAVPAATDLVFLLTLLRQPRLETSFNLALSWQKYSHIPRTYCSFPTIFPQPFTMRLFLCKRQTIAILSNGSSPFDLQRLVVTLLA